MNICPLQWNMTAKEKVSDLDLYFLLNQSFNQRNTKLTCYLRVYAMKGEAEERFSIKLEIVLIRERNDRTIVKELYLR